MAGAHGLLHHPAAIKFKQLKLIVHFVAGELTKSTPWFDTYKKEFMRMLLFNDHETFDHPLASMSRID